MRVRFYYAAVSIWNGMAYTFDHNEFFLSEEERNAYVERFSTDSNIDITIGADTLDIEQPQRLDETPKRKLVQLFSDMVGQAISLSVVEPETKTEDFVEEWLDNHNEEVNAAFCSSSYSKKGLDEAAEEYEKNEVHSISVLGTDKDGYAYYMRSGTTFADAFKAGAEWRDKQIPKLPDNLDDAAFNYACGSPFRNIETAAFKAGAEWMAEQGEAAEVGYWNQTGLSVRLDKAIERLGFEEGDKVMVYIRKA